MAGPLICSGPENSSSILSQVHPGGAGGPLNLVANCAVGLQVVADGHRLLHCIAIALPLRYCIV